jgi:hypothetical protein
MNITDAIRYRQLHGKTLIVTGVDAQGNGTYINREFQKRHIRDAMNLVMLLMNVDFERETMLLKYHTFFNDSLFIQENIDCSEEVLIKFEDIVGIEKPDDGKNIYLILKEPLYDNEYHRHNKKYEGITRVSWNQEKRSRERYILLHSGTRRPNQI